MKLRNTIKKALLMLTAAVIMTGCSTPKNIAYFQDAQDSKVIEALVLENNTIKIEPHDKLSIVVSSKEPALAQLFNLNVISSRTAQSGSFNGNSASLREYAIGVNEGISTYTVSPEGTIDFPVLGELNVKGMTRNELAGFIKGELMGKKLINDPVVTVEFLNMGINILGDVNRPGRYDLNTDVITLVDAIALAGDLGIQGQRENVMVMRRTDKGYETYSIDLTNAQQMTKSPGFYLKQGDMVYVEPNNIRKRQTTNNGNNLMNISFWLSVASLLTTAAVLLK